MNWIMTYKPYWRLGSMILLLVALNLPWATFDIIHVPSPWECSEPWVRMNENFCGLPASPLGTLITILLKSLGIFPEIGGSAIDSSMMVAYLPGLIYTIPLISSLVLLLKESELGRIFHIGILVLFTAYTSFTLYMLMISRIIFWGLWLYVSLLMIMLLLEIITIKRKPTFERI
jgi:hypothetical protein